VEPWWNAEACGGFDLTELWGVDTAIATDRVTVFGAVPLRSFGTRLVGWGFHADHANQSVQGARQYPGELILFCVCVGTFDILWLTSMSPR
jgi:hypothetical protein